MTKPFIDFTNKKLDLKVLDQLIVRNYYNYINSSSVNEYSKNSVKPLLNKLVNKIQNRNYHSFPNLHNTCSYNPTSFLSYTRFYYRSHYLDFSFSLSHSIFLSYANNSCYFSCTSLKLSYGDIQSETISFSPQAKTPNTSKVYSEIASINNESLDMTLYIDNPLKHEDYKNDKEESEKGLKISSTQIEDVHSEIEKSLTVDKNKDKDLENLLSVEIKTILSSEGFNEVSQKRIERLAYSFVEEISSNSRDIVKFFGGFDSSLLTNKKFIEFILIQIEQYDLYVHKLKLMLKNQQREATYGTKKRSSRGDSGKYNLLLNTIFNTLKVNDFRSSVLTTLFRTITYHNIYNKEDSDFYMNTEIYISIEIGKYIINRFIRELYKKDRLENKYRLRQFREDLMAKDEFKIIESDEDQLFAYIGLQFINIMYEVNLIKSKLVTFGKKEKNYILFLSDELANLLKGHIINKPLHMSLNLPMIVKPRDYVMDNEKTLTLIGGYYLNNELFIQPLINNNPEHPTKPKFLSPMILDSLNSMMKVPFKINTRLLEYFHDNSSIFFKNAEHPFTHKKKRSKAEEKQYQSYVSEQILERYILMIADIYRNAPEIYFPLMLDFRGRIYNRVTYLNYQGSELAKSLLLFARPCIIHRTDINSINYLKSYTATCYGNGLDKKSYDKKLE
jgi:hypothetical protein